MRKRNSLMSRQRGGVVLKVLLGVPAVLLLSAIGWYVYADQRLKYWDSKVQEMCEKEGGIKIFERVPLDDSRYLSQQGDIRIPAKLQGLPGYALQKFEAQPDDLFFRQTKNQIIHVAEPRVTKEEIFVVRNSDKKVLGQLTNFGRVGGDLVAIDFESRFVCPANVNEQHLFREIFITQNIQGAK